MIPMSLRPNAHDNVRVWDFYTVVKSLYHFGKLPWADLMISGFITSSDGGKLAKSKGNAVLTPQEVIAKYSADVTRYWAGGLSLGKDTMFSFDAFESGKKLQNKIWNASKFILPFLESYKPKPVELKPMDRWILAKFGNLQKTFIKSMDKYEIAFALDELERFFWDFCDNYIEIVKDRLYNPQAHGANAKESGQFALYTVLLGMLKMFHNFMPHITEEIYSQSFANTEPKPFLHMTKYSEIEFADESVIEKGNRALDVIAEIRKKKSVEQVGMKTRVKQVTVQSENTEFLKSVEQDIKSVGSVDNVIYKTGQFAVEVGELVK
jgi:valyl-tRNA synthetase